MRRAHQWLVLLVLLLFVSTAVVECSKFKELYPEYAGKAAEKAEQAKSKFVNNYGNLKDKIKTTIETSTKSTPQTQEKEQTQPNKHSSPHQPQQQQPLITSKHEILQIVVILSFGAVLAWLQVRQHSTPKKPEKPKKEITKPSPTKEEQYHSNESDGAETDLVWEIKEKPEKIKAEKDEPKPAAEDDVKVEEGESPKAEEVKIEGETKVTEETAKEVGDGSESPKETTEKPKEEDDWIVVNEGDGEKATSSEDKVESSPKKSEEKPKESKEDSDKETELVVSRVSHRKSQQIEQSQLDFIRPELHQGDSLLELTAMFKKLKIKPPDENTPIKERIEIAKMIQKEKRLIIKQKRISSELELKRQSHELKVQKEERKIAQELQRQNSLHLQDDEFHKSMILHLSAGIMLAIWLKIMDFNLFTLPLLGTTQSSYFPSSFTLLYQLTNLVTVTRIVYAALFLVVAAFLWVFVSKLAPYIVLVFAFLNAWQSIFRAGLYFSVMWCFATFTFYMVGHIRTQLFWRKMLKLSVLYTLNLLVAALIGGLIAHGDPLNPYKITPYPDKVVEYLLSFIE